MRRVAIESPYAADDNALIERNLRYLRACMADCFARGEAPFASHGLYTQPGVLDDKDPAQRKRGMDAGFEWRRWAHVTVVYTDLGISRGMRAGIEHAGSVPAHAIEFRELGGEWSIP